jgi:hypothetical protein
MTYQEYQVLLEQYRQKQPLTGLYNKIQHTEGYRWNMYQLVTEDWFRYPMVVWIKDYEVRTLLQLNIWQFTRCMKKLGFTYLCFDSESQVSAYYWTVLNTKCPITPDMKNMRLKHYIV